MSQAVTKPVPRHALPRTGGPGIALPAAAASLASLLLVAAAAAASLLLLQPPAPVSRLAPADQFSAERAMDHVRAIAVEPHPAGSPAQAAARDYIVAQLAKLGMPVSVRGETSVNDFGQTPYGATYRAAATVENVVGRLPGRTSAHPLILLASYDSVPAGPGANNSAAAVAALIETARALRTGPRLRNDVVFLFTDGEEYGLLGAKAFAERNPWVRQAGAAINFTSRGSSGPVVMFQTGPDSGELVGQLAAVVPRTFASSLYDEAYRFFPNATDLSVFIDRGVPGLNFAYFGGFDRNHSPLDTAASVDVRSVQQLGDYALPLTRRLADLDLGAPRSANPTYFDVLGRFTVVYPAGWQLPLTALAVGLWTAAAAAGLGRRRLSVRGLLAGMGLFVAAVVAAAGVAAALAGPLGGRHAEFAYYGDTANGTTYLAGFVSLAVGAIVAAAALARRRLGGLGLAFGASVPWAALAAATAFVAPGTNYLFAWPLLFAAVALGAGALGRPAGTWRRLLQAVCCVPAVVLAAPLVVLLAQTLGLQLVAVAVVLAALAMGLLLPLLPRTRRQWAASAGAAALGVALLGAATVPAAPTAAHPRTRGPASSCIPTPAGRRSGACSRAGRGPSCRNRPRRCRTCRRRRRGWSPTRCATGSARCGCASPPRVALPAPSWWSTPTSSATRSTASAGGPAATAAGSSCGSGPFRRGAPS